jgi:hypothetical protein
LDENHDEDLKISVLFRQTQLPQKNQPVSDGKSSLMPKKNVHPTCNRFFPPHYVINQSKVALLVIAWFVPLDTHLHGMPSIVSRDRPVLTPQRHARNYPPVLYGRLLSSTSAGQG